LAIPAALPRYTPDEYLALEREAEVKSEFIDGYIYAMGGGSPEHSLIKVDLAWVVRGQLRGGPCKVYDSDMRVQVDPSLYAYPDLTVVCGEGRFDDRGNLLNPTVIFEVLSPSTEAYDRGEKFNRYQGLPTLRQYVLVNQSKPRIEVFTRQPGDEWTFSRASGLEASIHLESIDCTLPLREVFAQAWPGAGERLGGRG